MSGTGQKLRANVLAQAAKVYPAPYLPSPAFVGVTKIMAKDGAMQRHPEKGFTLTDKGLRERERSKVK